MSFDKLTKYLDLIPEIYGIPHSELSVRHNHELVYRHAVGDFPHGENSLYKLFSMTKLFTVTAVMSFIEEGKLGLDDPVYKYLPSFEHMNVLKNGRVSPARKVITIRHLLSMRGGLTYNRSPEFVEADKHGASTREMIDIIAKDPLIFEPGDDWFYSFSHDVLGAVLEVIAGKKFSEIIDERIMKPLGITGMGFLPTEEEKKLFVPMCQFNFKDYSTYPIDFENYMYSPNFESGGGGLYGSNNEYMKLPDALANGGVGANGARILKPETIAMIYENHMPPSEVHEFSIIKPGYGYGLGVRTLVDPIDAETAGPIHEFGWDGAAASYVLVDTENHLSVVWTTHVRECRPAYREIHPHIRNLVYSAIKKA